MELHYQIIGLQLIINQVQPLVMIIHLLLDVYEYLIKLQSDLSTFDN